MLFQHFQRCNVVRLPKDHQSAANSSDFSNFHISVLWNRQTYRDLVFVRHTYGPRSKCKQTPRRARLSFSGCWTQEGCEWQPQALCSESGFQADGSDPTRCAASQACCCFHDWLWCRPGRNWEWLGHSVVSWGGRSLTSHSISEYHCGGKRVPTIQDWSGGRCSWMSYEALAGSLVVWPLEAVI